MREHRSVHAKGAMLLCAALVASMSSVAQELEIDHFPLLRERPLDGALTTTDAPLAPLEETFELPVSKTEPRASGC